MDTVVNNERGGPDKYATEPERFRRPRPLVRAVAPCEPCDVSSVEQRAADPSDVRKRATELRVTIRVARGS